MTDQRMDAQQTSSATVLAGDSPPTAEDLLNVFRSFILQWEAYRLDITHRLGVSVSELTALSHVSMHGAVSTTDLARVVQFTSGAATSLIDRLAHRGLVERRPHPTDRRVHLVALTAEAEDFLAPKRRLLVAPVAAVSAERLPLTISVLEELTAKIAELCQSLTDAGGATGYGVVPLPTDHHGR